MITLRAGFLPTAAAMLAVGCGGGSPTAPSPSPSLPLFGDSEHYVYYASPGDSVDTTWQEQYHAWATAALGVAPRRITYYKYQSRSHMQQVVGIGNTNAYTDRSAFAIHTIWPTDNHEVVHLFTADWGDPVALINEGMAVAHQVDPTRDLVPRWGGTTLHELARQFHQDGRLLPLADIVETSAWRTKDPNVVYPESGSFIRWLLDVHGVDRMRALYSRAAGPGENAGGVRSAFLSVYGFTLEEAEGAWLITLRSS